MIKMEYENKQSVGYYLHMCTLNNNCCFGLEYLLMEGFTDKAKKLIVDGIDFCNEINNEFSNEMSLEFKKIIKFEIVPPTKNIRLLQRNMLDMNDFLGKAWNLIKYKERVRRM